MERAQIWIRHTERLLKKLRDAVGREIGVQKQLCSVVGALDLLFQAATPLPPPVTSQVFARLWSSPLSSRKKRVISVCSAKPVNNFDIQRVVALVMLLLFRPLRSLEKYYEDLPFDLIRLQRTLNACQLGLRYEKVSTIC